jgi:hypothetical protein
VNAKQLLSTACVQQPAGSAQPFYFGEMLRRNPLDPTGSTCLLSGTGFGLVNDSTRCTATPGDEGSITDPAVSSDPSTVGFRWTNPLVDGSLAGVTFCNAAPATLHTGERACIVGFAADMSGDALAAVDSNLVYRAAAYKTAAYKSAATIAGMTTDLGALQKRLDAAISDVAKSSGSGSVKLTALRADCMAQCPSGQPCGRKGALMLDDGRICVTAPPGGGPAVATPCDYNGAAPQLWTLTATQQLLDSSEGANKANPMCLTVKPATKLGSVASVH